MIMTKELRTILGIFIIGMLGVALGEAIRVLEKRVERWRPELRS